MKNDFVESAFSPLWFAASDRIAYATSSRRPHGRAGQVPVSAGPSLTKGKLE